MALIVEDGSVVAGAESYASVSYADTYWSNRSTSPYAATWAAATTAQKESALRMATQYIDTTYYWDGYSAYSDQELAWPRNDLYDDQGYAVYIDTIPEALKKATAEGAARALSGELLPDSVGTGGEIIRKKLGPMEIEYAPIDNSAVGVSYKAILNLLRPFITGNGSVNLVRA